MENKNSTRKTDDGRTILAREHERRTRKRRRRTPKIVRYLAAILVIVLVFTLTYIIVSKILSASQNVTVESQTSTEELDTLHLKLNKLTQENETLKQTIAEQTATIEKYNARYGPLDASSDEAEFDPFTQESPETESTPSAETGSEEPASEEQPAQTIEEF